jgi:hypothetical protein
MAFKSVTSRNSISLTRRVPRAEPFDSRKLNLQIPGEPVDNLAAPLLSRKLLAQVPADQPIEEDEFPVNRKSGLHLGGPDAALLGLKEFLIAGGQLEGFFHVSLSGLCGVMLSFRRQLCGCSKLGFGANSAEKMRHIHSKLLPILRYRRKAPQVKEGLSFRLLTKLLTD